MEDAVSVFIDKADEACDIDSPSDSDESVQKSCIDNNNQEIYSRVKVDRKKFENLLKGVTNIEDPDNNNTSTTLEEFFKRVVSNARTVAVQHVLRHHQNRKIMFETNTNIEWPLSRLKKDPCIKIYGSLREQVSAAEMKILNLMEVARNTLTLKIDVAHTEHSHIIGKGGFTIKQVMNTTECHIHFPDSNRSNSTEKSNQVSIAGQPYGVESARQQVRALQPLVYTFFVQMTLYHPVPDISSPEVQAIAQKYKLNISFKISPGATNYTEVVTKGLIGDAALVKEGTKILMEYLLPHRAESLGLFSTVEVSPQHHVFVFGKHGENLQRIISATGARITLASTQDILANPLRRGTLYIHGTIESICKARAYIISYLPIVAMFDLPGNSPSLSQLDALQTEYKVFLSVKAKSKNSSGHLVTAKTAERMVPNIYHVRRILLGIQEENMPFPQLDMNTDGLLFTRPLYFPPPMYMHQAPFHNPLYMPTTQSISSFAQHPYNQMTSKNCYSTAPLDYQEDTSSSGSQHSTSPIESPSKLSVNVEGNEDWKAPGIELERRRNSACPVPKFAESFFSDSFDFEKQRMQASNLMKQSPVQSQARFPTDKWAGLGFSRSSPESVLNTILQQLENCCLNDRNKMDPFSATKEDMTAQFCASSYLDAVSGRMLRHADSQSDLASVLACAKLGKYMEIFQEQEIDLSIFLTLSEDDLVSIGISSFGVRKKMMMTILQLNAQLIKELDSPLF